MNFKFEISNSRLGRVAARRLLLSFACLFLTAYCLPLTAYCSWERQKTGTMAWLRAVFFVDERRGWAVGGRGALLETSDGGASWRPSRAPTEDNLRDAFFVDARRGWLVCEREWFKLATKTEPRSYLLKTTDGGATWARVEAAGADVDARLVGVRFADPEHGWAFGELGAVYATADGGRTWAAQGTGVEADLYDVKFLDEREGWAAGASGTLIHTTDGGRTWAAAQSGTRQTLERLFFAGRARGWAVGFGGTIIGRVNRES